MADAEAVRFDTGAADGLPYLNFYVGNGGVVATARAEVLFHCGGGGPTASPNRCPRDLTELDAEPEGARAEERSEH